MYPLADSRKIGDMSQTMHACIPHQNSAMKLEFDYNLLVLTVIVPFVTRMRRSEIEQNLLDFKILVAKWKEELEGQFVCDVESNLYYRVVTIEVNTKDFVKRCDKGTPMSFCVAWLLPLHDLHYLENPNLFEDCVLKREVMYVYCEPFEAEDVYTSFEPVDAGAYHISIL